MDAISCDSSRSIHPVGNLEESAPRPKVLWAGRVVKEAYRRPRRMVIDGWLNGGVELGNVRSGTSCVLKVRWLMLPIDEVHRMLNLLESARRELSGLRRDVFEAGAVPSLCEVVVELDGWVEPNATGGILG